jgi:hypothetical protein
MTVHKLSQLVLEWIWARPKPLQNYPPVFAARGGRVVSVLHVVGVVVPAAVRGYGMGEGGDIVAIRSIITHYQEPFESDMIVRCRVRLNSDQRVWCSLLVR